MSAASECSSLWVKFVKKIPIFPTFFPNKRRWERDCNIPSWAQHCFKKSFLALKNRTFQVKSKTTKIVNKAGHYNSFFLFLFQHFKTQLRRVNETTTNQQDVVLKISQREIDYHTFNCWCNFQCWLFSLQMVFFAKFYCCCNFQTVLILIYTNERTRSNFLILIQLKGK